ncbi:MAG: NAD(P)H-hydrate dehydratase [Candidatus Omnitrophica bacterium]|nr:NAD(P)H-hydrate dehydratase [Candidatus Omnitrophota bacterium]
MRDRDARRMIPPNLLPPRPAALHKGEAGRVLVIAGSAGLTGAAALCALGALRTGAGLVTLALPGSLHDLLAGLVMEATSVALPETRERSLSPQALPKLIELVERADAVAIGPGLSEHRQTVRLVRELLSRIRKPCVVDADALNAVDDPARVFSQGGPFVLTPHPGEMGRLARMTAKDVQQRREATAKTFAAQQHVVLALKGHRTVIAAPDGQVAVNDTGHPGMASGGCGDVLTGMIAALLGQGLQPFDAARLGVYLHGLSGDLVAARQGQVGLIASDLASTIPQAIRQYQQHT